jgi:hypothetical protein
MSQAQFLADASRYVIQAAFWCSVGFVVWYSICAPWWRYPVGRAIVALDSAIALALGPSVLGLMFGVRLIASIIFSWLTVCAFAAIPAITIYRGWIVWRAQRRGGHRQEGAAAAGSADAG